MIEKIIENMKGNRIFTMLLPLLPLLAPIYYEDVIYRITATNYYKLPIEYFRLEEIGRGIFLFRLIVTILIIQGILYGLKKRDDTEDKGINKWIITGLTILNKGMIAIFLVLLSFMSILEPFFKFKMGNGLIKSGITGEYSNLIFYIICAVLSVLFYKLLNFNGNSNKKFFFQILLFTVLMWPTVNQILLGAEIKKEYEIIEINKEPKAILSHYNGQYLIVDCKIRPNEVIKEMNDLFLDTRSFELVEMTNKKIKYKNFRKVIVNEETK